jgi:hypothetical protein
VSPFRGTNPECAVLVELPETQVEFGPTGDYNRYDVVIEMTILTKTKQASVQKWMVFELKN